MATDNFKVITSVGTAVGINAVYQLRHDRDPFPVIFVGGIWMGACVAITAWEPSLGITLAFVYLLAVFLTRGTAFIDFINKLTTGIANTTKE